MRRPRAGGPRPRGRGRVRPAPGHDGQPGEIALCVLGQPVRHVRDGDRVERTRPHGIEHVRQSPRRVERARPGRERRDAVPVEPGSALADIGGPTGERRPPPWDGRGRVSTHDAVDAFGRARATSRSSASAPVRASWGQARQHWRVGRHQVGEPPEQPGLDPSSPVRLLLGIGIRDRLERPRQTRDQHSRQPAEAGERAADTGILVQAAGEDPDPVVPPLGVGRRRAAGRTRPRYAAGASRSMPSSNHDAGDRPGATRAAAAFRATSRSWSALRSTAITSAPAAVSASAASPAAATTSTRSPAATSSAASPADRPPMPAKNDAHTR